LLKEAQSPGFFTGGNEGFPDNKRDLLIGGDRFRRLAAEAQRIRFWGNRLTFSGSWVSEVEELWEYDQETKKIWKKHAVNNAAMKTEIPSPARRELILSGQESGPPSAVPRQERLQAQ